VTSYYRVMLSDDNGLANECFIGGFIGTDYDIDQDLTNDLGTTVTVFNNKFVPIYLSTRPSKSAETARNEMSALHRVSCQIQVGDRVVCKDGPFYRVGEVTSEYHYVPAGPLQHRRSVRWLPGSIARKDMSLKLAKSAGLPGTAHSMTRYRAELEQLLAAAAAGSTGKRRMFDLAAVMKNLAKRQKGGATNVR